MHMYFQMESLFRFIFLSLGNLRFLVLYPRQILHVHLIFYRGTYIVIPKIIAKFHGDSQVPHLSEGKWYNGSFIKQLL